jgi:hypothetical protein
VGRSVAGRLAIAREPRLDQLLLARLHREVGLGEREGLLLGVAVLGDQVGGVSGEGHVLDAPSRARAQVDHFVDGNIMVVRIVPALAQASRARSTTMAKFLYSV